jgi:hypothetical protein
MESDSTDHRTSQPDNSRRHRVDPVGLSLAVGLWLGNMLTIFGLALLQSLAGLQWTTVAWVALIVAMTTVQLYFLFCLFRLHVQR